METTGTVQALAGGGRTISLACRASDTSVIDVSYAAGSEFDTHVHSEAYVCLVREGWYEEWAPGARRRSVATGNDLIYAEGSRHSVRVGSQGACVLHVTACKNQDLSDPIGPFGIGVLCQIAALVRRRDPNSWDDADFLHLESLVIELHARGRGSDDRHRLIGAPGWLNEVRTRLREEYKNPISLGELASQVGRHPTHLSRAFLGRWAMTPGEYLRRIRVAAAVRLIRESEESFSKVAVLAGFSDQSHMNRLLRQYVGATPRTLRKERARPNK